MAAAVGTKISNTNGLQKPDPAPSPEGTLILEDPVQAELKYLVMDPKYESEKPYSIRYDTGGAFSNTNMENESKSIAIRDFSSLQNSQSFEEYGFSTTKIDCNLATADFYDEKKVNEIYYPAIDKLLRQSFPDAMEINILEHGVSISRFTQFEIS